MFRGVVAALFYTLFAIVCEHRMLPLVSRIAGFCFCRLEISCVGIVYVCACLFYLRVGLLCVLLCALVVLSSLAMSSFTFAFLCLYLFVSLFISVLGWFRFVVIFFVCAVDMLGLLAGLFCGVWFCFCLYCFASWLDAISLFVCLCVKVLGCYTQKCEWATNPVKGYFV